MNLKKIVFRMLDSGEFIMLRVNFELDLYGFVINQNNFKLQKKNIQV